MFLFVLITSSMNDFPHMKEYLSMDRIKELRVCGTCEHSHLIPNIEGEIALNICRISSAAVNKDGGLTYCIDWTPRRKLS